MKNAQQVNRNLTYTKDEVTKDKLKTYAEEQKLTGIIILDVNGKVNVNTVQTILIPGLYRMRFKRKQYLM